MRYLLDTSVVSSPISFPAYVNESILVTVNIKDFTRFKNISLETSRALRLGVSLEHRL